MKPFLQRIMLSMLIIMIPHMIFAQNTDESTDKFEEYNLVRSVVDWGMNILSNDSDKKTEQDSDMMRGNSSDMMRSSSSEAQPSDFEETESDGCCV